MYIGEEIRKLTVVPVPVTVPSEPMPPAVPDNPVPVPDPSLVPA